jgi:hypothetical protein
MQPPIVVHDSGDVMFFRTVERAEQYIEPWAVDYGFCAYDSQGRRLNIKPNGFVTKFEAAEAAPNHADELKEVVINYLLKVAERVDISTDWINQATLAELIQVGISKCETR